MPYTPDPNAIRKAMEALQTYLMQEFDKIGRELEVLSSGVQIPAPEPHEPPAPPSEPIFTPEGFGKIATGGTGKTPYVVTTLLDSGPGSLRDAISVGGRNVTFSVGGTINLASQLVARGPDITIDCLTAPAPGITLKGNGIGFDGRRNAHNIILRGLRVRDAPGDGISCFNVQKILIDRCSSWNWADGGIDMTQGCKDITVQWCLIGAGSNVDHNLPMLMYGQIMRISILNNLFFKGTHRQPSVDWRTGGTFTSSETTADIRNNLLWKYWHWGMQMTGPVRTNIIGNFFYADPAKTSSSSPERVILKEGSPLIFASDNYSHNGYDVDAFKTVSVPHVAIAPLTTYTAKQAAHRVKDNAGPRGPNFNLDAIDQAMIDDISGLPDLGT